MTDQYRMPDTAMVLAAGLGTRMRPLTDDRPKPLIEVAGKALIDYTLDRFADAGVKHAVVNVHYLADQVEAHVIPRHAPQITISDERRELLETGGGLVKARPFLGDAPFFCANTDAILVDGPGEEACQRLAGGFDPADMDALLLLAPKENASGFDGPGDVDLGDDGAIKWRSGDTADFVFTGLQILSPSLLADAPEGAFSTKLLWEKARLAGRLKGVVHDGRWMHVGDPKGLALADSFFTNGEDAQRHAL